MCIVIIYSARCVSQGFDKLNDFPHSTISSLISSIKITSAKTELIVFDRKILWEIVGAIKDTEINGWIIRRNERLKSLNIMIINIVGTVRNKRLQWTGHACRSQNPLLRTAMKNNPTEKRPLRKSRMRWQEIFPRKTWKNLKDDRIEKHGHQMEKAGGLDVRRDGC